MEDRKSLKELKEKSEIRRIVLETLLYYATEKGEKVLPTMGEFVLSEVSSAVIEYLTEKECNFAYRRYGNDNLWEWLSGNNKLIERVVRDFGGKLNADLQKTLMSLIRVSFDHDGAGDRVYFCWLTALYKRCICDCRIKSTFSLSVEFIRKVENKTIPLLDEETIKHCQAIAKIMKKYINRDIEFIKKTYYW